MLDQYHRLRVMNQLKDLVELQHTKCSRGQYAIHKLKSITLGVVVHIYIIDGALLYHKY